ncbi:MAG: hypothetical protein ACI9W2_005213, partial [Gammaproteobacteria bacterium]
QGERDNDGKQSTSGDEYCCAWQGAINADRATSRAGPG